VCRISRPSEASNAVTVRQLLTHTSGITGEAYVDCGRSDDAVERYGHLADVEMFHLPGAMYSYCNSCFNLAGRLVKRITGIAWDTAFRREILDPLWTTYSATLPEEALRFRTAVCHVLDLGTGSQGPGELCPELRSGGSSGNATYATATEHSSASRACTLLVASMSKGDRILAADSVAATQRPEVASVPSGGLRLGLGPGLAPDRCGDQAVVGHNGVFGAALHIVPSHDFAIASLTSASRGPVARHRIRAPVVQELLGLRIPSAVTLQQPELNLARFCGKVPALYVSALASRSSIAR
jgi:CubicO group peptidase (beta-lactamase class C family)